MDEETQAAADAQQTLDLVLSAALSLAAKVVAFVEEHRVAGVTMTEELEQPGLTWDLLAMYGHTNTFVEVKGTPRHGNGGPRVVSMPELAQLMQNSHAAFHCNLPRAWVEMAFREAQRTDAAEHGIILP